MAFEKAHDISLDEPCVAHQAILFMLDVLMRSSKTSLTLEELYDSFGDKSFTPQMLRAVGGNEQGLKTFILKYPSLFTINNDLISANSGGTSGQLARLNSSNERYLRKSKSNKNVASIININNDAISSEETSIDVDSSDGFVHVNSSSAAEQQGGENHNFSKTMKEIEQEAIVFFRKQISKREEDWLPIVSVAGHASQSSPDIRKFVGPQNEFKAFLLKYPHIFCVREEYCGLKGRADCSNQPFPPPSPPPRRRMTPLIGTGASNVLIRNHSFKSTLTNRYSACANLMPNAPNGILNNSSVILNNINASSFGNNFTTSPAINSVNNNTNTNSTIDTNQVLIPSLINSVSSASISTINSSKTRLTSFEVKAVHYVMRVLHKNGRMLLQTIPGLISRAPDHVSSIVGFTREDLIQFFKRHSAIFQLHPDGCVSVKQDAVKALILKDNSHIAISTTNSNNSIQESEGIITNSGVILRIFPKYGILNMENNEQVFFDIQSCQFETFSDLTTILHISDRLYFNAVIGPRDGSTKWKSIKTWIKMRAQQHHSPVNSGISHATYNHDNFSSISDAEKSDDSLNELKQQDLKKKNSSFTANSNKSNLINDEIVNNTDFYSEEILNINEQQFHSRNNNDSSSNKSNNLDLNQYLIENGDNLNSPSNPDKSDVIDDVSLKNNNSSLNNITPQNHETNAHGSKFNYITALSPDIIHEKNTPIVSLISLPEITNDAKKNAETYSSITKFMKQSTDNISIREIINSNHVNVGCQTLSTGDIQVTNIFIE